MKDSKDITNWAKGNEPITQEESDKIDKVLDVLDFDRRAQSGQAHDWVSLVSQRPAPIDELRYGIDYGDVLIEGKGESNG